MIHAQSKPVFPLASVDMNFAPGPGWLSPWSLWGSWGTAWINKNEHQALRSSQTTEKKKKFSHVDEALNPQKFVDKADFRNAANILIFLLFQEKTKLTSSVFIL